MVAVLGSLVALILSGDLIDAAVSGVAQDVAETGFMLVGALAGMATLLGIVLFSVGMTRARVFPPAAIWVFLGSMVLAFLSETFEQSLRGPVPWLADTLPPLGFMVAELGLLAIGYSALNRNRPSRPTQQPVDQARSEGQDPSGDLRPTRAASPGSGVCTRPPKRPPRYSPAEGS